jgi:hypothetical protein
MPAVSARNSRRFKLTNAIALLTDMQQWFLLILERSKCAIDSVSGLQSHPSTVTSVIRVDRPQGGHSEDILAR